MGRFPRLFLFLFFLLQLAFGQAKFPLSIYTQSDTYSYYGCFNETTEIEGSDHSRALSGGASLVRDGDMTVPLCLSFCAKGVNGTQFLYAGLEWSRECWCSRRIAGIAKKLDDPACDFPCEGNKTLACGGSLKLSVYKLSAARISLELSSTLLLLSIVAAATMLVF